MIGPHMNGCWPIGQGVKGPQQTKYDHKEVQQHQSAARHVELLQRNSKVTLTCFYAEGVGAFYMSVSKGPLFHSSSMVPHGGISQMKFGIIYGSCSWAKLR